MEKDDKYGLDVVEELNKLLNKEIKKSMAEELAMTYFISWLVDGV